MNKICQRCGKEFICTHDKNCFCTKYILDKDTLNSIKKQYTDCICEECLKEFSLKERTQD